MEKLIFKYLTREISSDEEVELKEWLDENPQNRQSLAKLESFYSNTNSEIDSMKKNISPIFLDQIGGVRLSQSRLTGKAIISGFDPELMTSGNRASVVHSCLGHYFNQRFLPLTRLVDMNI